MTRTYRRFAARAGFTLLEVMLALTLTAIAAGIAGTTLTAARRTAETITAHERTTGADERLRAMLGDMLRHGAAATVVSDAPGRDALVRITANAHGQQLTFLSRGVVAPFGTGPVWRVTLESDGERLVLLAVPLATRRTGSGRTIAPLRTTLPGVTRLDVEVLEPATALEGVRWRRDWPLAQARPAAIALDWFGQATSGTVRVPFVVALDPLAAGTP